MGPRYQVHETPTGHTIVNEFGFPLNRAVVGGLPGFSSKEDATLCLSLMDLAFQDGRLETQSKMREALGIEEAA